MVYTTQLQRIQRQRLRRDRQCEHTSYANYLRYNYPMPYRCDIYDAIKTHSRVCLCVCAQLLNYAYVANQPEKSQHQI